MKKVKTQNTKQKDLKEAIADEQIGAEFLDYVNSRRYIVNREVVDFLLRKVRAGDKEALREIFEIFGWLIKESAVIYRKHKHDKSIKELTEKATFGIQKAALKYKIEKYDFPFASYAMWWILKSFNIDTDKISIPKGSG